MDIISDERGYYYFHQFLKAEFAEENLEFWAECEKLGKMENVPKELLLQVFDKYIKSNMINIPAFVQKDIEVAFTSEDIDKSVFDAAQEAVIDNLR